MQFIVNFLEQLLICYMWNFWFNSCWSSSRNEDPDIIGGAPIKVQIFVKFLVEFLDSYCNSSEIFRGSGRFCGKFNRGILLEKSVGIPEAVSGKLRGKIQVHSRKKFRSNF